METAPPFFTGQLLLALPGIGDPRFEHSVIAMISHDEDGAMGIVVNHPAQHISFPDLLVKLDVIPAKDKIQLPSRAGDVTVLKGGPVETERGFVLHSRDWGGEGAVQVADRWMVSSSHDILRAIGEGRGPARWLVALGYAGWSPGQLENEMQQNGWLHCSADPELIFGLDVEAKYDRAMQKIGIRPGMLSSDVGHA